MATALDSSTAPDTDPYAEFTRLGRGGRDDQMGFRVVVGLLLRCVPLLRPVRWPLFWLVAAGTFLAVVLFFPIINIVNVFWNGVLDGKVLSPTQAQMLWLPVEAYSQGELLSDLQRQTALRHLVWGSAGIALIVGPAYFAIAYGRIWILQRVNQDLRLQMLDRLQSLSLRFHSEQQIGDSIYRMTQDSAMVTQLIDVLFIRPLEAIGRFLFSLAVVMLWDPWLALALLFIWPGVLLLGNYFSRRMRVGFRRARETNSALTSRIQETLAGIKVIKAYGAESEEQARFEEASHTAFRAAEQARNRFALFKVMGFNIVGLFLVGGVGWGTYLTIQSEPLYGQQIMVALGFASVNLGVWDLGFYNNFKERYGDGSSSTRKLIHLWAQIQDIATGLDRVFELIDLEPEVEDAADAVDMPPFSQEVEFKAVSFGYRRDQPVLQKFDLRAEPGTITAIVGPTGSGKSTLMSLLLRLYDPDEGSITIDGRDLRQLTLKSLRDQISIALQENVLFGTTVRENIRYAAPQASDAEVREVARVACADEFIRTLAEGYDTMLGERGTKLSTGQRQRISIARALLKDTAILVLDEPTASLDAATELQVLRNLNEWGKGRAIFLITHRLSTIRRAHQVAVVEGGRLAEFGSHVELMGVEDGIYRGLIDAEEGLAAEART